MANEPVVPAQDAPAVPPAEAPAPDAPKEGDKVEISAKELADIRAALSSANKEAKDRRLELDRIATEQSKAEETRLAEQGKFQELATTREQERDTARTDLATATDRITQLEALVVPDIDARTANWPEELKALVPKDGDVLARLQKITELTPAALLYTGKPAAGGVRPGPVPSGAPAQTLEEAKQRKLQTSSYQSF